MFILPGREFNQDLLPLLDGHRDEKPDASLRDVARQSREFGAKLPVDQDADLHLGLNFHARQSALVAAGVFRHLAEGFYQHGHRIWLATAPAAISFWIITLHGNRAINRGDAKRFSDRISGGCSSANM